MVESGSHFETPSSIWFGAEGRGNPYMELLAEHIQRAQPVDFRTTHPAGTILLDLLRYRAPDIFHVHWLGMYFLGARAPDPPLYGLHRVLLTLSVFAWMQRRGTKLVWTAHNLHNHEKRLFWLDRLIHHRVAAMADGIITHSPSARRIVEQTYGLEDADRICVIPHGHYIDVYPPSSRSRAAMRARYGVGEEGLLYLYFGRIRRYKNVPLLVDAFQRADLDATSRLCIAGSARTDELSEDIAMRIEPGGPVTLEERFIPDEDVRALFEAADVVVLPYESILTSGSAVLAMSMGKPVIAPRLGGITDLLDHQSDLLYDSTRAERGLTAALEYAELIGDRLDEIGRSNLARAREWDWPGIGRRTVDFYRRVLARG